MRDDHRRLMDRLRQEHSRASNKAVTAAPEPVAAPAFDFSEHKSFKEIRLIGATGATLGIGSPFFRRVLAVDGSRVCIDGVWLDNYCSYDYAGLNQDPRIAQAVTDAVERWGVSATASRIVGGERAFHVELEDAIADFLGVESALTLVSGHATNVAILRALLDSKDVVYLDARSHNSLFEGVIASGAKHFTFPHNDPEALASLLSATRANHRHAIIATEGLYSMDGDLGRVDDLLALKDEHNAWLLVDEAHSLGVLGKTGRGIAEHLGIAPERIDIHMGTLSKCLCSSGGYVAGSRHLVELLKHKAPGFLYSVGLSAPAAAGSLAALSVLRSDPNRVVRLEDLSRHALDQLKRAGMDCGPCAGYAVIPVMIGDSIRACRVSNALFDAGIYAAPIIAPAVPDQSARLRFFITVNHTRDQLDRLVDVLAAELAA